MSSRNNFFELFHDLDFVGDQVLSFCDFKGLVALGRTCHQMKSCSDVALNKIANDISVRLCYPLFRRDIAELQFESSTQVIWMKLKKEWSIFTLTAERGLEDLALIWIRDQMTYEGRRGVRMRYSEDPVRNYIREHGKIRLMELSNSYVLQGNTLVNDWQIEIKQQHNISVSKAVELITNPFATEFLQNNLGWARDRYEQLDNNFTPIALYNEDVDYERLKLSHFALCILRMADPASITLTQIKLYYVMSGRLLKKAWSLKFKIPSIRPKHFEVKYYMHTKEHYFDHWSTV